MYKQINKICNYCGREYIGDKNRKYCGYDCSHASRQKQIIRTCSWCGENYSVQEYQESFTKFCSRECKHKSMSSDLLKIICTNCGKEFERKSHKVNRIENGNNFCCHPCQIEYNRGANHYEYKEFLHDKNIKLALKQWSKLIKEKDNYTCTECGNNNICILEAHHIKHRSKSPELIFDISNGTTLCLYCHLAKHEDDKRAHRIIFTKIKKYESQFQEV